MATRNMTYGPYVIPTKSEADKKKAETQTKAWKAAKTEGRVPGPNHIKQAAAGVVEMTVADASKDGEWYRPSVLYQVPATVGVVNALFGRQFDNKTRTGRVINSSMERSALASERTNKTLGITYPKSTGEQLFRVGGSLAIPGSVVGKGAKLVGGTRAAKVVKNSASVTKAAKAAKKVKAKAAPIVAKVPKPVRTTAKVAGKTAVEIALPLRQTKTVKGTAALLAGTALAADQLSEKFDPGYESDLHTFDDNRPTDPFADMDLAAQEFAQQQAPDDQLRQDDPFYDIENPSQETIDAAEEKEQEDQWSTSEKVLAGLGIGLVGTYIARKALDGAIQNGDGEFARFAGKQFRRSGSGIGERTKTNIVQQDQPLRNRAEQWLSPQHAAEYNHNSDLISNTSIGDRTAHQLRKNGTLNVAQNYAKELNIDEQRMVDDALLAQSSLDDFNRTGTLSSLNLDRSGNPVTPAQLRTQVAATRANPKLVKYMDAVTKGYQDLLNYRVARGLLSPEKAAEMRAKRPNYVRMSRDLETEAKAGEATPFNANEQRAPGFARNEGEKLGVQGTTGVGSPLNALMDDWAQTIRHAEHNDLRGHWLENMAKSGATTEIDGKTVPLVQRVKNGVKPATSEGIHQVFRSGKAAIYKVNDAILSNSLEYAPRASIPLLENMRQIAQNTYTGPVASLFNWFSFVTSPIYDASAGIALKPNNMHLGVVNEVLSKIHPKASIGVLDPTAILTGYTGAPRYFIHDMQKVMADNLTQQLMREHSWLRSAIGDQNVTALRDSLQKAYSNSINSQMHEFGMTSRTMHGSPDPAAVMSGLEDLTPDFKLAMAKQLEVDTFAARAKGEVGPLKPILQKGKTQLARARATSFAKLYAHLLEASHNGFRYSALAANKGKGLSPKELASQIRRISVDSSQHGSNNTLNKVASAIPYANLSIQSLAALGGTPKARLAKNILALAIPALAAHYVTMATDRDAYEQHVGKSAEQKAASITMFGGAELKIAPELRLFFSPLMTVLDHATGMNTGEWNRSSLEAMFNWIDNPEPDEDLRRDMKDVLWADVVAANPLNPEAFPPVAPLLASLGIDPGMSRISGEAVPVRTQKLTGFDPDQARENSLVTANQGAMIGGLFGSAGQNFLAMVDDAYHAYHNPNNPGSLEEANKAAWAKYTENVQKSSGLFRPLFGQYEAVNASSDTNTRIVKDKKDGIELATKIYNTNVKGNGRTGTDPTKNVKVSPEYAPEDASGTKNAIIGAAASNLQSRLKYMDDRINQLSKQAEAIRGGYNFNTNDRNADLNQVIAERKRWNMLRRAKIEEYETIIGNRIGDPNFSFDTYNPDDYREPVAPSAPARQ
jgi:hypothetical protein